MQASGWLYGLLPALKKIHTNKRDLARAMKGHMGFFQYPSVFGDVCYRHYSAGLWSAQKRTLTVFKVPKLPSVRAAGWDWRCDVLAHSATDLRWDWGQPGLQGSILGAIIFLVMFNVVHLGLRFGLAHYAYRMGVAAIPLIKNEHQKSGATRPLLSG